ncbi:MAG TPA: motility protein A [Clostridiaceae bacterium]|nr:motility protein A [Clostridiaceae bacterium]
MDIATFLGIVAGVVCIVISILLDGSLRSFYDLPSIFITIGGGIASVLVSYRVEEIAKILKLVGRAFSSKQPSPGDTIRLLVGLSQKARREGLLALESEQENIEDDYIRESLQLIIDGVEPDTVRESMNLELENLEARHLRGQSLFKTMGALFPAWGMIGTLIGLINLLEHLDEPSKIGPSMAVALVTTFYGSVLANFVCNPIATKLAIKSKEEIRLKEMIIEGILSIQAGENPRIMEHKLKTFLSPEQKKAYDMMEGNPLKNRNREESLREDIAFNK